MFEENQILLKVKIDARVKFQFITILLSVVLICATGLQTASGMPVGNLHPYKARSNTAGNNHIIHLQEEPSRLDTFTIYAPQLRDTDRTIYVYLPPDYHTSDKQYPVIYLQDGGMLFSTSDRDVQYNKTLDQLFDSGTIDGIIAVGIASSSSNRWDEYSPWKNNTLNRWVNNRESGGGEGNNYLDFIVNTLKPHIDTNYRTLPDRENTGIGGFSMGALISVYAGLSRPEVFSKVMATSPAVWFAENYNKWLTDNQLLNYIASIDISKDVMFYIDIGTNEWADQSVIVYDNDNNEITSYPYLWKTGAETLYNYLRAMQVPESNLMLVIEEGGIHDAPSWGGRFGYAMTWLYGSEVEQVIIPTIEMTKVFVNTKEPNTVIAEATRLSETKTAATAETELVLKQEDSQLNDGNGPRSNVLLIFGVSTLTVGIIVSYWYLKKGKPFDK